MHNLRKSAVVLAAGVLVVVAWSVRAQSKKTSSQAAPSANDQMISNYAQQMLTQGRRFFASTLLATKPFGGTLCASTRRLLARSRAVSVQE
jgi:hypothetical protein